ncbi:MAG TPA: ABC transporter ATP-binding protein/permease [Stellaceae bacterium]|nr:ABC transporter ATP-binding protein/permease [Stellaceae bacterium]
MLFERITGAEALRGGGDAAAAVQLSRRAARRRDLMDAWRLTRPYFMSEEKVAAWTLLAAVVLLNLANVYVHVRINQWSAAEYNALGTYNYDEFIYQFWIFLILSAFNIIITVYALYLNQMLQIRWRRWLTRRYIATWLADRTYFRLQLSGASADNPDQRIQEDLNLFTTYAMSLSLGLLTAVVSLFSFLFILWDLSGPARIPLGAWGTWYIPGYLVWAALLYSGIGTWLSIKVGRPLVPLNFAQQRFEADFRYSLIRLRENAESVAFYGGEAPEYSIFRSRFANVVDNFWRIMVRRKHLSWFTASFTQAAIVFPILVAAPRYFAKQIQLGGLIQVLGAFGQVQNALSFIVTSYPDIAAWQACTERLSGFEARMRQVADSMRAPQQITLRRGGGVEVQNLDIDLPDGTALLRGVNFSVAPGQALLLVGPTGSGKSTTLRAMAGLWPFGKGDVGLGEGLEMFLPQKPYLPLGTLRQAMLYPREDRDDVKRVTDERLEQVLKMVNLGGFARMLDTVDNWALRLSLGEQQRLAFARVILIEPAVVIMDEATSALDEPTEAMLYGLLRKMGHRPTIVSVGHRSTLREFHDKVCDIGQFR